MAKKLDISPELNTFFKYVMNLAESYTQDQDKDKNNFKTECNNFLTAKEKHINKILKNIEDQVSEKNLDGVAELLRNTKIGKPFSVEVFLIVYIYALAKLSNNETIFEFASHAASPTEEQSNKVRDALHTLVINVRMDYETDTGSTETISSEEKKTGVEFFIIWLLTVCNGENEKHSRVVGNVNNLIYLKLL